MSIELAIQSAVFTKLNANLTVPVYDNAPQVVDAAEGFPYVTIGEDTINEWDTDDTIGGNVTVTIHTWSRYPGRKETKEIQSEVDAALNRATDLTYAGYHFLGCDHISSDSFLDADGLTRHGVQSFRIYIERV